MATKHTVTKKPLQKANDDAVVYKVMIALALACACLVGLRSLRTVCSTVDGYFFLYDLANIIALVGALVAVAATAVSIFCRNKILRTVAPWIIAAGVMLAATGRSIRVSGREDFGFLYFLCIAMLVQFVIFQLYRWEFFLFSLSTMTACGLFFSFRSGLYWTAKNITLMVLLVLVLAGTTLCSRMACRNKGFLSFGKGRVRIYGVRSAPILLYIVNALWLICGICIPLFGGLFAYYCMFAAIAVEFIAAVYYTFQLN